MADDVGGVRVEPTDFHHAAVVRIHHIKAVCRHAADDQLRKYAGFLYLKKQNTTTHLMCFFLQGINRIYAFLPVCMS